MKNKDSLKRKNMRRLAGLLAITMATSSLMYYPLSVAHAGEQDYEKYEQAYQYGKQAVDMGKAIINGTKAAADTTKNVVDTAKQSADAAKQGANAAKAGGGAWGQVSAGIGAASTIYGLATGDMSDPGSVAKSMGDLVNNASNLGVDLGSHAGDYAAGLGYIGSVFGEKISDTMTYRGVGNKVKFTCQSSNPYPSINEKVEVTCEAMPTGGAHFVTPPVVKMSATPTSGGKDMLISTPVLAWECDDGCWVVGTGVAHVEYNAYEGDTTMGGDMFFNFGENGGFSSAEFTNSAFSSGESAYSYDPTASGSLFGEQGTGALSDALGNYYVNVGNTMTNTDFYSGTNGSGYTNGEFSTGGYTGGYTPGHYDANGNWIPGSDGLNSDGSAYNWNGSGYSNDYNSDLHDNGSSFNAGGADWASSSGGGGYYDANGQYHDGMNPYDGGHYDANGQWVEGGNGGYYDANGNWHEGGNPYGSDTLDGYFNSNGGEFGTSGMTDDITGLNAGNSTVSALEALANGGHVGEDGIIYDAEGNAWGSAQAAGLIAMEEGSDQLNNVLAQGGWIDANGNVFDANGKLVGYVVPAGSLNGAEADAFGDADIFAKSEAMLQEFLNKMGNANGGDASLMERLNSAMANGSLMESLKSTFGMASSEDIRKETMTPQQMYDAVRNILKEMGYSDEDIAKGLNYSKGSAYTEPDKAWDMNRITTMQKNFKIDTHIRLPEKGQSVGNAAGQFGAVKAATGAPAPKAPTMGGAVMPTAPMAQGK